VLHAESDWEGELGLPIALTIVGAIATGTTGALALVSLEWTIGVVAALLALLVVGSFSAYRRRSAVKQQRLRGVFESVLDQSAAILHEEGESDVVGDASRSTSAAGRITLPDPGPTGVAASNVASRGRGRTR